MVTAQDPMSNASVTSSSEVNNSTALSIDGDSNTKWISNNPLPTNYFNKSNQNILLDQVNQQGFSPVAITDGNGGSMAKVSLNGNVASLTLDLNGSTNVSVISLKAKTDVDIRIYGLQNNVATLIATHSSNHNFQVKRYNSNGSFDQLRLEADQAFDVFEWAAIADLPTEYITVDLGSTFTLSAINTRHWAGSGVADASRLLVSTDGNNWDLVSDLDPNETNQVTTPLNPEKDVRYIRVAHDLFIADWKKVYVWEIEAIEYTPPTTGNNDNSNSGVSTGNSGPSYGWNAHAGYVPSYTEQGTFSASSATNNSAALAHDKNEETHWTSDALLPMGFIERADLNVLIGQANTYGVSNGTSSLSAATDKNGGSSVTINGNGNSWFALDWPTPQTLETISLKAQTDDGIQIYAIDVTGDSLLLGTYESNQSYQFVKFDLSDPSVSRLSLTSTSSFKIFELGGLADLPKEYYTFDFGASVEIGVISTRHWSYDTDVYAVEFEISTDGLTWNSVGEVIPSAQGVVTTRVQPVEQARYFRVVYTMSTKNYAKAFLWEVDVYDRNGKYGEAPDAQQSSVNLRDMLGVNTIWGWGHDQYSDQLSNGEGASLHQAYSDHARYYHNMHWDVSDPDQAVDYVSMENGNGTEAFWWLDWNREYEPVTNLGMILHNTIQFDNIDPASWDNPYQAGYNYGYAYAQYFGPTHGKGFVQTIEVGNEPWTYDNATYRDILAGMAQGIKAADPAIQVLPCALQATDPSVDLGTIDLNYLGSKVGEAQANLLDGLNIHAYSFANDELGIRRGVHPEAYNSDFHNIRNMVRFRDANMPGKPIYLTEWGWDTNGAGSGCTHGECVGEQAGALYAVRGALMAQRYGMERATYYFYGNTDQGSTLFSRSGLVGNKAANFQKKKGFLALESLVNQVGDRHFIEVVQEDENAYVYLLGDANGNVTHVVAWRPVDAANSSTINFNWTTPFVANSAVLLDGSSNQGTSTSTPSKNGSSMVIPISSTPIVIALGQGGSNSAVPASTPETMVQHNGLEDNINPQSTVVEEEHVEVVDAHFDLENNSSSVQDNTAFDIAIYPNPTTDMVQIDRGTENEVDEMWEVRLYDERGVVVMAESASSDSLTLNLLNSSLSGGTYFVQASTSSGHTSTQSFIFSR